MRRHRMSRRNSRKSFSKAADLVHKKNLQSSVTGPYIMRGGTRL